MKSILALSLILTASFAHADNKQECSSAVSNYEMQRCVADQLKSAEAALVAANSRRLVSQALPISTDDWEMSYNKELAKRMRLSAKSWLEFRDAECSVASMDFYQGSGEGLEFLSCQLQLTLQKTQQVLKSVK